MPFELTTPYIVALPLLGAAIATVGTLAGLGGGFVLLPVLLFLFPQTSPAVLAFISLAVVFLNASSASLSNWRARRIDLGTAWILLLGAIPGAIGGAIIAGFVSRQLFERAFGGMLLLGAVYILWRSVKLLPIDPSANHRPNRIIRERRGPVHTFYVSFLPAAITSPIAGFVSGFFGIGSGILLVPSMTFILKMPLRIATATSLAVVVPTALTGILTHIAVGQADEGWRRAGLLGLGAILGGQLGVYLSSRVDQRWVLRVVALGLFLAGTRLVVASFT